MVSYYRQLSADNKIKIYMLKSSFVSPERPYFNFMIFHLNIPRKLSVNDGVHYLSVWLGTDSNSPDINRFQSHTGKCLPLYTVTPYNLNNMCELNEVS